MLALPRSDLPFVNDTDSSSCEKGADLFQTCLDGERKPIRFWSWSLNLHEMNYPVAEKELLVVLRAIQTLRPYIKGTHFSVYSVQASLRWNLEIQRQTADSCDGICVSVNWSWRLVREESPQYESWYHIAPPFIRIDNCISWRGHSQILGL